MRTLLVFMIFAMLSACGGERTEKDLTDSEGQDISPNQTISEEEQRKKDSTALDIIGQDTTQRVN